MCAVAGCAASDSPTGPTAGAGLVVRVGSGTTTAKAGDRDTVRAFVRDANGGERETAAIWSVENESIVRLDGPNGLVAVSPGSTTIRAAAEGLTASLGLTVVKNFQGTWSGFYNVEECTRVSGSGSYCRFAFGRRFMRLEVVQRGQQISGQVSVGDNLGNVVERGSVTGEVGLTGSMTLTGKTSSLVDYPGTTEFAAWTSDITPAGLLEGRCSGTKSFTNAFGPQVYREEYSYADLMIESR